MDEEFVGYIKRIGFALLIAIIFVVPMCFFVYYKFDNSTSDILGKINADDSFLIFVDSYKCNDCKEVKQILKDYKIDYYNLNKDTDNMNYRIILNKIQLSEDYVKSPSLIYIENGELSVQIDEFDKVNLEEFFLEKNLIEG